MSFSISLIVRDVNGKAIGRRESKVFERAEELDVWYQKNRYRPDEKKRKQKKSKVGDFKADDAEQLPFFSSDMLKVEPIKRKTKRESEAQE